MSVDLAQTRADLEARLARLDDELGNLEKGREAARQGKDEYSGYGNHIAEAATETFEAERDLSLIDNLEHMRAQVREALRRVEDGAYGLCQTCGKVIPAERLEALPFATQCVVCKSLPASD
ncbi:MAG TPA: TraR/DksA C4-type zinc finger protein [Candidatus Dormibacteraeota bacterium]|nr:TraR/DksA C4-type zinc finger protein [Candidatus Dormibacteraeota bacterium]